MTTRREKKLFIKEKKVQQQRKDEDLFRVAERKQADKDTVERKVAKKPCRGRGNGGGGL